MPQVIVTLARYHVAYTAPRVGDIAVSSRDEVVMAVKDGLTGRPSRIQADVKPRHGWVGADDTLLELDQKVMAGLPFFVGKTPVVDDMPSRDNERVPSSYRIDIAERHGHFVFQHDSRGRQSAERASHECPGLNFGCRNACHSSPWEGTGQYSSLGRENHDNHGAAHRHALKA